MKQICSYRKGADIMEVVPNLGIDVNNAIETGIIQDTSSTTFHNMMKDLSEVGPVVRDPFDAIDYDRAYGDFKRSIEDDEKNKNK